MNLELLESFGQNYPEEFDGTLDCVTMALTCAFNRRGTLLAVGCNDGRLIIWDFLTRGIAKVISAHTHPVPSLSWSRTGHKLLTASTDNTVCLWDVVTSNCDHRYRFPCPVLRVQFNPKRDNEFLVCPMRNPAYVIHVNSEENKLTPDEKKKKSDKSMEVDDSDDEKEVEETVHDSEKEYYRKVPVLEDIEVSLAAAYDHSGKYIFVGNGRGRVFIVEVGPLEGAESSKDDSGTSGGSNKGTEPMSSCKPTLVESGMKVVHAFRVAGQQQSTGGAVKSIEFSRRGEYFLVNTADRIIRVYRTSSMMPSAQNPNPSENPEPLQKLQDLVNKTMWKKVCFSGDGEYICAGSARSHALYFWDRGVGNLVKILHGTKGEILADVVWHPVRPIVCSVASGVVSIWSQNQVENWSAFAPDFKELDENVEYEERESEFDLSDEDKSVHEDEEAKDDDVEVDITRIERISAFCSSDEEDEDWEAKQLIFLPCTPDVEDPEDARGLGMESPSGQFSDSSREHNATPDSRPLGSSKRRRTKVHDVHLDAPVQEAHPYLAGVRKERGVPVGSGKKVGKDTRKKTKERGK